MKYTNIQAWDMELIMVRAVHHNQVNDVGVFKDVREDTGNFYTIIAIYGEGAAKTIVKRMALEGLFENNPDFKGNATYKDALLLMFKYYPESLMYDKEELYASDFAERKEAALNFLLAMIKSTVSMGEDIAQLLLREENINLIANRQVTINYFMDFTHIEENAGIFYKRVAERTFDILARDFLYKYENNRNEVAKRGPHELGVMVQEINRGAFTSLGEIAAFVKELPDSLITRRFPLMRIWDFILVIVNWVKKNPYTLFFTITLLVTLIYLIYQIRMRAVVADNDFIGLLEIGDVFLGEIIE
ncbi:MAG: hypothetical protein FWC91_10975 [Defluviitaleaceae bacterium]|nr:hypothetical protein [Defluviitaleaceae bacterium]